MNNMYHTNCTEREGNIMVSVVQRWYTLSISYSMLFV